MHDLRIFKCPHGLVETMRARPGLYGAQVGVTGLGKPKRHQRLGLYIVHLPRLSNITVSIPPVMAPTSTQDCNATASIPSSRAEIKLEPGIYVPTVAFFTDNEEVDTETTHKHALRLASSGIKGIGQDVNRWRTEHVLTWRSFER